MKDEDLAVGKIVGAVGGVLGLGKLLFPWIKRMWFTISCADSMARAFGPEAGPKILRLIQDLQRQTSVDDLRHVIKERRVGLGLYMCSVDGSCTFANDVVCEMFGLGAADMLGYGWLKNVKDSKSCFDHWRFCVSNGLPYRYEYVIVNEGETLYETSAYPAKAPDGTILCYVGFVAKKL